MMRQEWKVLSASCPRRKVGGGRRGREGVKESGVPLLLRLRLDFVQCSLEMSVFFVSHIAYPSCVRGCLGHWARWSQCRWFCLGGLGVPAVGTGPAHSEEDKMLLMAMTLRDL